MIEFILPLFGRFHPILVHLPIGFLVFGVILIFGFGKKYSLYSPIIQLAFLLGGISAAVSSIPRRRLWLGQREVSSNLGHTYYNPVFGAVVSFEKFCFHSCAIKNKGSFSFGDFIAHRSSWRKYYAWG